MPEEGKYALTFIWCDRDGKEFSPGSLEQQMYPQWFTHEGYNIVGIAAVGIKTLSFRLEKPLTEH
jgi:hypothetical protein